MPYGKKAKKTGKKKCSKCGKMYTGSKCNCKK